MSLKKYVLTLSCPDTIGIVAEVSGFLAENRFNIYESAQFNDEFKKRFFMRVVFECQGEFSQAGIKSKFAAIGDKFEMDWEITDTTRKPRVLLMVSKSSHCLNHLLHKRRIGTLNAEIPVVVSNHPDLRDMAEWHKIPFNHLPVSSENRAVQEQEILKIIQEQDIDLVVLARYMQVLSKDLCSQLSRRAINIHHSFLPSFKGANPYKQAFDKGVKIIGATAHYITENLDEGPIIDQEVIRVEHTHTPEQLVQAGSDIENLVLARAVQYHIEKRVLVNGNKTIVFK